MTDGPQFLFTPPRRAGLAGAAAGDGQSRVTLLVLLLVPAQDAPYQAADRLPLRRRRSVVVPVARVRSLRMQSLVLVREVGNALPAEAPHHGLPLSGNPLVVMFTSTRYVSRVRLASATCGGNDQARGCGPGLQCPLHGPAGPDPGRLTPAGRNPQAVGWPGGHRPRSSEFRRSIRRAPLGTGDHWHLRMRCPLVSRSAACGRGGRRRRLGRRPARRRSPRRVRPRRDRPDRSCWTAARSSGRSRAPGPRRTRGRR